VEYLENGRPRNLAAAAAVFALAMATKFSAVLLIPILAALYGFRWVQRPREFPIRRAGIAAAAMLGALFVVVSVLYWPETVRCLTTHVQRLYRVVNRDTFTGEMLYRAGKWFALPAHEYFRGLNNVASHNAAGHDSYLLGQRSDQGWWYYFPVVFGVKSTLAALAAAVLLLGAGIRRILKRATWRGRLEGIPLLWAGLLFPPLFYFAFSMTSAIDIGMRHILPVYPFLYVGSAALLARLATRRAARYAMLALGALQIAECASIAPDYLAFFNALSGGPAKGPDYLVDSNIDWGQDVKKLVKWLDAHGTRTANVFYFGNVELGYYGIDDRGIPAPLDRQAWERIDGWLVADVTPLKGVYVPLNALAPVRLKDPVARVGWTMYVYDLRKPKRAAR
jgi:4-amino-4-deoxy-L-arabinose transferase-like glycosyltransferase